MNHENFKFSVENFNGSKKWPFLRMRSKRLAKNGPKHSVIAEISRPMRNLAWGAQIWSQILNRKQICGRFCACVVEN